MKALSTVIATDFATIDLVAALVGYRTTPRHAEVTERIAG